MTLAPAKVYKASTSKGNKARHFIKCAYALGQRRCPVCCVQLVYTPDNPNSATFEHMVPKSAGGTRHKENGMMMCYRCNNGRGNKCWIKWINEVNPPKKEWLIKKYVDAVEFYREQNIEIQVRFGPVNVYIKNLTINT